MPSNKTSVVVRGRPNVLQAAGRDAGRKLMEIKRLREKGHLWGTVMPSRSIAHVLNASWRATSTDSPGS